MENVHNAPTSDMVDTISCGKTVERTADDSLKIEIKTLQHLNQDSNDHNPAKDSLTNRLIRLLAGFRGFAFSESQRSTFIFAYQTMGMVYGGLSTTPLYLYSSIPFRILSVDDYLGVLSIIFWTLTLIGGVKYVLIVLHADDHGEGGTFALYSLLRKRTKINTSTHEVCQSKLSFNLIFFIKGSKLIKNFLFSITMLATCMVIGDGVLTPAISVLSAIEGLKVAAPSISQGIVVVVSVLLLVALFLLQRFGTQQISFMFSPIIVTWLTTTPLIGLYNIVMHYPTVYKAISPYYMLKFFSTHGKEGWLALGGTTLCITGAEAMFADLGHFNKASMQLGFLLAVYPSNMITYAGLTAYLIRNPEHQSQAFFKFTPDSLFWPMFIVSTLAAIVASQALISACFSLVKQCVALDCFPRVQIIHTSREHEGQVYSPEVNFSLMALCTAIVIGFHNGSALGNAYGVAVIVVMLITTLLLTMVMIMVWGVSVPVALAFFCFFTFIEACNLSAVLSKVPRGGWLPFMLSCMLAVLVFSWVHGRKKKRQHELSNSISITAFKEMLVQADVKRVPGVCFAYTNAASFPSPHNSTDDASYDANHALKGDYGLDDDNHVGLDARVPPFLQHYVHTAGSLHRVVVLTRVHKARVADVPKADRFVFTIPGGGSRAEAGGGGLYICTVQVGYAQRISEQCKGLTWVLLEHLEDFIRTAQAAQAPASSETIAPSKDMGTEARERWEEELAEVARAKQDMGVLACHMVGRAKLKAHQTKNNCVQRLAIDKLYALLQHNCIPALLLEVPTHNLLELNIMYEV